MLFGLPLSPLAYKLIKDVERNGEHEKSHTRTKQTVENWEQADANGWGDGLKAMNAMKVATKLDQREWMETERFNRIIRV